MINLLLLRQQPAFKLPSLDLRLPRISSVPIKAMPCFAFTKFWKYSPNSLLQSEAFVDVTSDKSGANLWIPSVSDMSSAILLITFCSANQYDVDLLLLPVV